MSRTPSPGAVPPHYPPGLTAGDVLRRERFRRGEGLRAVCRDMGISSAHLSEIERNHKVAGEDLLCRLAARYGLDAWELLLRDGRVPEPVVRMLRRQPRHMAAMLRALVTTMDGRDG